MSDIVTGLVLNIEKERYDDKDPQKVTGLKTTLINVSPKNDKYLGFYEGNLSDWKNPKIWTSIFEHHFRGWRDIEKYFLVKFKYYSGGALLTPYQIIRYGTHGYDVATVLGQNYNHTQLCLYGEKLGEVVYDTCNNKKYPYIDFINTGDKLVVKFPKTPGNYMQIIDNISLQQRKCHFIQEECWLPGWARDNKPQKYTFSPTGQLLSNTGRKER